MNLDWKQLYYLYQSALYICYALRSPYPLYKSDIFDIFLDWKTRYSSLIYIFEILLGGKSLYY